MKSRSYAKIYNGSELSIKVILDDRMKMIRWDIIIGTEDNILFENYTYDLINHKFNGVATSQKTPNKIMIFNQEESRQNLLELLGAQMNSDIDFLLAM